MLILFIICFSCSGYSQCEDTYLNKTKPVVKQQMVKDSVADNKDSGIMTKIIINEDIIIFWTITMTKLTRGLALNNNTTIFALEF